LNHAALIPSSIAPCTWLSAELRLMIVLHHDRRELLDHEFAVTAHRHLSYDRDVGVVRMRDRETLALARMQFTQPASRSQLYDVNHLRRRKSASSSAALGHGRRIIANKSSVNATGLAGCMREFVEETLRAQMLPLSRAHASNPLARRRQFAGHYLRARNGGEREAASVHVAGRPDFHDASWARRSCRCHQGRR